MCVCVPVSSFIVVLCFVRLPDTDTNTDDDDDDDDIETTSAVATKLTKVPSSYSSGRSRRDEFEALRQRSQNLNRFAYVLAYVGGNTGTGYQIRKPHVASNFAFALFTSHTFWPRCVVARSADKGGGWRRPAAGPKSATVLQNVHYTEFFRRHSNC